MDNTYLTNPQQPRSPSRSQLINPNVKQAYQNLHKNIQDMQMKVQHKIAKNQSQFLFAYRNHIAKIKRELQQIKKKSQEQEKMFSSNDRIKFLERQINVFREEALKIYDKLEKTTAELESYKRKYEDMIKHHDHTEKSSKESYKQTKIAQAQKAQYEIKIAQLINQLKQKDQEIQKLRKSKQFRQSSYIFGKVPSIVTNRSQNKRYDKDISSIQHSSARKTVQLGSSFLVSDNDFKSIFMECLKKVKKQIGLRKNAQKIDFTNITSIRQFREIDKMNIFQLFFSNPQVEMWLYEKLFPNPLMNKLELKSTLLHHDHQSLKISSSDYALPFMKQVKRRKNFSKFEKLENKNISII